MDKILCLVGSRHVFIWRNHRPSPETDTLHMGDIRVIGKIVSEKDFDKVLDKR